jgi:serine/threonine protein kinase
VLARSAGLARLYGKPMPATATPIASVHRLYPALWGILCLGFPANMPCLLYWSSLCGPLCWGCPERASTPPWPRTSTWLGLALLRCGCAVGTHIKTGHRVAVKILNRAQIAEMNMKEKVQREIAYLSRFSHPHINRLYEVIYTQTDIFMVIEFLSGGELFDHIVSK